MVGYEAGVGVSPHERVFANAMSEGMRRGKYLLFNRPVAPFIYTVASGIPALYTAAQGQTDHIHIPDAFGGRYVEMFQTTAQTLPPVYDAKGLLIAGDAVDNESLELVPGGNTTHNPLGYTAGTDPGVFIRATLELTDTSEIDQLFIGWRKQEAYAVPVSFLTTGDALYTDFAGMGFSGTAVANLVKTMTDINNAGSTVVTSTAFAWADTTIHQLEVRISKRVVQYRINGKVLGETVKLDGLGADITDQATVSSPTFTVDSGDFMIPMIFLRRGATAASAAYLRRLEVGQLLEVGLQPEGRGPQSSL